MSFRNVLLVSAALGALALTGCTFFGISDPGSPVTEEFDASGVEEVVLAAPGDMVIVRGDAEKLVMDTGENIAERIDVTVDGGVMEIEFSADAFQVGDFDLDLQLEVPNVVAVASTGSGSIEGEGFKADEFRVATTGSGGITLDDIDCEDLVAEVTGSGSSSVSGKATTQMVEVTGSGSYDAQELQSDVAEVTLSGSGSATVWVADELDAEVSGSGSIDYYGEPDVSESVSGSGDVDSRGSK